MAKFNTFCDYVAITKKRDLKGVIVTNYFRQALFQAAENSLVLIFKIVLYCGPTLISDS